MEHRWNIVCLKAVRWWVRGLSFAFWIRYEYLWADGQSIKKPLKVSASEYIDYLMTWVESQINNEQLFPCQLGKFSLSKAFPFRKTSCRLSKSFLKDFSEFMLIFITAIFNTSWVLAWNTIWTLASNTLFILLMNLDLLMKKNWLHWLNLFSNSNLEKKIFKFDYLLQKVTFYIIPF